MGSKDFILLTAFFILLILLPYFLSWLSNFIKTARYLKMEINRTEGAEQKYWNRQLKKHYLSAIPFIGRSFRKK